MSAKACNAAAPPAAAPLVEVRGLKKYFPVEGGWKTGRAVVKAVDGVDFTIRPGETLGLVGESGCGKSTTGRLLMRLERPTAGEILFEGRNIVGLPRREMRRLRQHIQIIFQDPYSSLNPRMTVGDIVAEPLRVHKVGGPRECRERAAELLSRVGLGANALRRYPHEFSGGQRQRVGIARALALNPKLVICDEPVSALDVSIQSQIINLLKDLQQELGLTYLFIAHGLNVVKHMSDRVGVMYLGKLVELAAGDELYTRPLHPYTQALLSAIPIPVPGAGRRRIRLTGEIPSPVNPPEGCRFHTRCPRVQDICREAEPPFRDRGGDHWVACHLV